MLKGGSITVPLTSCLTGLGSSVLQMKTKIVSCHTADSKPVKQEVNRTMILPHFSSPWLGSQTFYGEKDRYKQCRQRSSEERKRGRKEEEKSERECITGKGVRVK
jgi:hypothetical protein